MTLVVITQKCQIPDYTGGVPSLRKPGQEVDLEWDEEEIDKVIASPRACFKLKVPKSKLEERSPAQAAQLSRERLVLGAAAKFDQSLDKNWIIDPENKLRMIPKLKILNNLMRAENPASDALSRGELDALAPELVKPVE